MLVQHKMCTVVKVDVIIAVHNAETTIEETVKSAMHQETLNSDVTFDVKVCCYNDASTDKSIDILYALKEKYDNNESLQHDEIF